MAKNALWHLTPKDVTTWLALLEDVFWSSYVCTYERNLVERCVEAEEFISSSIDGTLRCAMHIKGQSSYRASKEVRDAALFPDGVAKRRVLSVRGRTGALICLKPVAEEDAESIADALKERMSEAAGGCFFVPLTSNLSWRVIVRVYIFFPSRYPCAPPYPPALVSVEFKQICAT